MAIKYYDDVLVAKLKKWIPSNTTLRVLKPDETKRFFETQADDSRDSNIKLPCVALSRDNDIHLDLNIKNSQSFDGVTLEKNINGTKKLNVLPIKVSYQLDIYAKTAEEADEYMREYLFKLINHPTIKIEVPYNSGNGDVTIRHIANIRVLDTVSDTSAIAERLFSGQFTRWTIQLELQDAFLFSVPYQKNWKLYIDEDDLLPLSEDSLLELSTDIYEAPEEIEKLGFNFKKVNSTENVTE